MHLHPPGYGLGAVYVLENQPIILGREKSCDIWLDDVSVSRRHVQIKLENDGCYAQDLKSTNGTIINDQTISLGKLNDGDFLKIGNWIFRFLDGANVVTAYHEEIYNLTIIDPLTGIYNRRYLEEFLDREMARAARFDRPLGFILLDIDHFKSINDRLGHLGGDETLKEIAGRIKKTIRKHELFARFGGEEFAVVLPEASPEETVQMAERLRQLVQEKPFCFKEIVFAMTVSLGAISFQGNKFLTIEDLIGKADDRLHQAKESGRNCVIG
ncbi:MAG TPA: GGDEF domain-containing protein [Gemmataceae bacterium]|nr:GGDEF domain-containing protein [Gemmataceae bacterium]